MGIKRPTKRVINYTNSDPSGKLRMNEIFAKQVEIMMNESGFSKRNTRAVVLDDIECNSANALSKYVYSSNICIVNGDEEVVSAIKGSKFKVKHALLGQYLKKLRVMPQICMFDYCCTWLGDDKRHPDIKPKEDINKVLSESQHNYMVLGASFAFRDNRGICRRYGNMERYYRTRLEKYIKLNGWRIAHRSPIVRCKKVHTFIYRLTKL